MKLHHVALALPLLAAAAFANDDGWHRFRGSNGSGVSPSADVPTHFGPVAGAAWHTPVPAGSSSPVVTSDAVFLTGATDEALVVSCLERESGEVRWQRRFERTHPTPVYPANDSASATPVTDGSNVYAFFPELGIVSLDARGEERWRLPLGPFVSFYGMASSPVLAGDVLVLQCDQQRGSFLIAVDAGSGEERWRTAREGMIESWSTPVVYPADEPSQVITFGSFHVAGYSLATGAELWRMSGLGYAPVCSPILDGDRLYASTPYHAEEPLPGFDVLLQSDANEDGKLSADETPEGLDEHFGWADADKDGFIVEAEWTFVVEGMSSKDYGLVAIDLAPLAEGKEVEELWRYKRGLPSIGSPILYEGLVYLAKDGGIVTGLDAASGAEVVRERLDDLEGELYPSPVAAGGHLYFLSNAGKVVVRGAGAEGVVAATSDLGEEVAGTPAIAGGAIFVRTRTGLACYRGTPE